MVEQDGGASGRAKFHGPAHMVDVSVRHHNLLDLQVMLADEREDFLNVIPRVNHHGFAGGFVADDRAVALQRTDGKNLVNHRSIVASRLSSTEYQVPS